MLFEINIFPVVTLLLLTPLSLSSLEEKFMDNFLRLLYSCTLFKLSGDQLWHPILFGNNLCYPIPLPSTTKKICEGTWKNSFPSDHRKSHDKALTQKEKKCSSRTKGRLENTRTHIFYILLAKWTYDLLRAHIKTCFPLPPPQKKIIPSLFWKTQLGVEGTSDFPSFRIFLMWYNVIWYENLRPVQKKCFDRQHINRSAFISFCGAQ